VCRFLFSALFSANLFAKFQSCDFEYTTFNDLPQRCGNNFIGTIFKEKLSCNVFVLALIPNLPDTEPQILVYCRCGNRGKQASKKLEALATKASWSSAASTTGRASQYPAMSNAIK